MEDVPMEEAVVQERPRGLVAAFHSWVTKTQNWWKDTVVPWAKANPKAAALVAAGTLIGAILYMGGSVLVNGLIAGILVAGAAGVLVYKMKHSENRYLIQLYNQMVSHPLITDAVLTIIALAIAPAGITGWVAASITALLASVWLLGAEPVELDEDTIVDPGLENTVVLECGE
jgi:hypothetical protein